MRITSENNFRKKKKKKKTNLINGSITIYPNAICIKSLLNNFFPILKNFFCLFLVSFRLFTVKGRLMSLVYYLKTSSSIDIITIHQSGGGYRATLR